MVVEVVLMGGGGAHTVCLYVCIPCMLLPISCLFADSTNKHKREADTQGRREGGHLGSGWGGSVEHVTEMEWRDEEGRRVGMKESQRIIFE